MVYSRAEELRGMLPVICLENLQIWYLHHISCYQEPLSFFSSLFCLSLDFCIKAGVKINVLGIGGNGKLNLLILCPSLLHVLVCLCVCKLTRSSISLELSGFWQVIYLSTKLTISSFGLFWYCGASFIQNKPWICAHSLCWSSTLSSSSSSSSLNKNNRLFLTLTLHCLFRHHE